ncbi:MAG: DNA recombination protein RmuC [uncultured Thiotrichaceae bacterium]|uniref:DNA recombination protein RmuC n=1 Tax=uncultured Thiotrichaceae bacterium TaxID=298394 RepID=A0A6S6UH81_9GAMM|nr:MAG: DNA recombination protein RmuC [uncultured Thiotrichaceae bacterium]
MDPMVVQPVTINNDSFVIIVAVIMFLLGFAIAWLLYAVPLSTARERLRFLTVESEAERRVNEEQTKLHEQTIAQMQNSFAALSQHALRENNSQFLQLAQETLLRFHNHAQHELEGKEHSIREMIQPLQHALDASRKQVFDIEKDRQESFGRVSEQMRAVSEEQVQLRDQTHRLVSALKRPEVRGQWGEITLKRLVEMAGMVEQCDFVEQAHDNSNNRVIRPDLVVTMPDDRVLIVDAKTPLDAYLEATQTDDADHRLKEYKRHAKIVRDHVNELSAKKYWEQFKQSPDFVVLFVPGEQFLGAALEYDKKLLEEAMDKKVILASPSTLIALLRSVSFGWKQVALSKNAQHIQRLGEDIYKRMATLTEHMARLGKSINSTSENYNKTLGSLERSVLPGVKRFTELGIQDSKSLEVMNPVEIHAREPLKRTSP